MIRGPLPVSASSAIALLATFVASSVASTVALAQSEPPVLEPVSALLERARVEDARTEYHVALALYEAHAARCLASSTAVLELEVPCAETGPALLRAFELARGLADPSAAERVARLYSPPLLSPHPREALRIGYELAQMHVDAGRLDAASAALERWVALFDDPPAGQAIVADAMRGRIATLEGRAQRAAMHFRRAERRYEADRDELDEAGPLPPELVRHSVADARLLRGEALVQRFLATSAPRARPGADPHEWWRRVITPWRARVERRLLLARLELERVYELGSPRHSVVAAARIGEMYRHMSDLHASMTLPNDDVIRILFNRGDRPGYDEALTHLETCVRWASHHGVAPRWARRCEESLNALDPQRFPLPAELAGTAAYLPVSLATPAAPR